MPSQQEIHDLAKTLIDNRNYYNKAAIYHANLAVVYSTASKSMKNAMKTLKGESRKRKNAK